MSPDTLEITRPPPPPRRTTLAIGLFEGLVEVRSALRDLSNHGFGVERVRLVASAASPAFDLFGSRPGEPAEGRGLHRVDTGPAVDATACIREILRKAVPAGAEPASDPACDDLPATFAMSGLERQAHNIKQHLAAGGGIIIVRVDDAGEQQAVCSMLLHYASRGVQTHQLRFADGGQQAGGKKRL